MVETAGVRAQVLSVGSRFVPGAAVLGGETIKLGQIKPIGFYRVAAEIPLEFAVIEEGSDILLD
jgi:hypothetical protein